MTRHPGAVLWPSGDDGSRPGGFGAPLRLRLVLPLRVERLDGARFRVTVFPALPLPRSGDPHADAAALMAEVNRTLEARILTVPNNGSGCTGAGRISPAKAQDLSST